MKALCFVPAVVFCLCVTPCLAHPPSDIQLSYDQETQVLHLEMKHVVRNARDHRIRKVTVTVNDQDPQDFFFSKQTSNADFMEDLDLPVPAGTKAEIKVKAFCSKAGVGEASLVVKSDP